MAHAGKLYWSTALELHAAEDASGRGARLVAKLPQSVTGPLMAADDHFVYLTTNHRIVRVGHDGNVSALEIPASPWSVLSVAGLGLVWSGESGSAPDAPRLLPPGAASWRTVVPLVKTASVGLDGAHVLWLQKRIRRSGDQAPLLLMERAMR
jgi:hypothetical protein